MARNGSRKGADAFVLALASGVTLKDAATAAGISERQAHRRVDEPQFRQRVPEELNQIDYPPGFDGEW